MFTSHHIKHSRLLLRHARKYLRYRHDKLGDVDREQIVSEMQTLRESMRSRDGRKFTAQRRHLIRRSTTYAGDVGMALARKLRSDFGRDRDCGWDSLLFSAAVQISTGSMQPTLNGIIGHPSTDAEAKFSRQIVEFVLLGRNYIDVVSREDDQISEIVPKKVAFFFTFSRLDM